MKRGNKIMRNMIMMMLAVIIVAQIGIIPAGAEGNWRDSAYSIRYNGDGGDVMPPYRQKRDDSYVYIKHEGDVGVHVGIHVAGHNGSYTAMYGRGTYVSVPMGQGYKITNYVVESFPNDYKMGNYKNISLFLMPVVHTPAYIHGLWSPDSI